MGPITGLHLHVFVDDVFWDEILILPEIVVNSFDGYPQIDSVEIPIENSEGSMKGDYSIKERILNLQHLKTSDNCQEIHPKYSIRISADGYFLSRFYILLSKSTFYRQNVVANFVRQRNIKHSGTSLTCLQVARIDLSTPQRQVIDFNWNNRIEMMLAERSELDHAMSWYSTFGGAFSALGEEFQRCAEIAGKISATQLRIAAHLGDPLAVARCKLYWALSRIQKGELRAARRIITAQFRLAKSYPSVDHRLVNMCLGIWAKLRYSRQLRAQERRAKAT